MNNPAVQDTPEWTQAFDKYLQAQTWEEAVYYLGVCAYLEGLPLIFGENERLGLYVLVGSSPSTAEYGICEIDRVDGSFYYVGG